MFQIKLSIVASALFVVLAGAISYAQTTISGVQSGTLGPGQYLVVGEVTVGGQDTLTIMPGTEFLHNGNHQWKIYGLFIAEGMENDSISFVRQNPVENHRWGGLRFQSGASANSTIDYVIIDNCKNEFNFNYDLGGGIYTDGVPITVTNSRISECDNYWGGGGVYASSANIIIENCIIVDCEAFDDGDEGGNGGGIYLYNCGDAQILNNIIARNIATGG
ncbi:hypothetical protein CEE37_10330 [candidate division LCP-89 bacterium B3_LCP]|uniref:Right handed beta helix domain-containing protein n=1 Tax=candidate division LCP-89 bacterium B3_LCP TaxID=2012998 RepID=A0A532UYT1_UNCL8|nr:MAG: hypothetical protein CEE37_10330 [candidate division LCP-89 bacterium B3_LCP]